MTKALKPRTPEEALRKMAWKFFGDACVLQQELVTLVYRSQADAEEMGLIAEEIRAISTCAERLLLEVRLLNGEKRALI